jgi:hypothetical protein
MRVAITRWRLRSNPNEEALVGEIIRTAHTVAAVRVVSSIGCGANRTDFRQRCEKDARRDDSAPQWPTNFSSFPISASARSRYFFLASRSPA